MIELSRSPSKKRLLVCQSPCSGAGGSSDSTGRSRAEQVVVGGRDVVPPVLAADVGGHRRALAGEQLHGSGGRQLGQPQLHHEAALRLRAARLEVAAGLMHRGQSTPGREHVPPREERLPGVHPRVCVVTGGNVVDLVPEAVKLDQLPRAHGRYAAIGQVVGEAVLPAQLVGRAPHRRLALDDRLAGVPAAARHREQPAQVLADDLDRPAQHRRRLGRVDRPPVTIGDGHGGFVPFSGGRRARERGVAAAAPRQRAAAGRARRGRHGAAPLPRPPRALPRGAHPRRGVRRLARRLHRPHQRRCRSRSRRPRCSRPTPPGSASAPTRWWSPTTTTSTCWPAGSCWCSAATATPPATCWTAGCRPGRPKAARSRAETSSRRRPIRRTRCRPAGRG